MNALIRMSSVAAVLTFFTMGAAVRAAVPATINYQGSLSDNASVLLQGRQNITFSIYSTASGGVALWSSARGVNLTDGLFNVELGASMPLGGLPFDVPYFLGVSVNGGAELIPRQPLSSVPYALKAADADTVGGVTATSLDQSGHVNNTANPHAVTAAQAGATTAADVAAQVTAHQAIVDAHHVRYSNADAVSAIAAAGAYALKAGDTMTGRLVVNDTTPGASITANGGGLLVAGTGPVWNSVTNIYEPGVAGAIPATGAGTRMMWYPEMAAFRVGEVRRTEWDVINIGVHSFASGFDTIASGRSATALGSATRASGAGSTALGYFTFATGETSTAMGTRTMALGLNAIATGYNTTASGTNSTAMGNSTTASGTNSTAVGDSTTASGNVSIAMGWGTTAESYAEVTAGVYNTAASFPAATVWVATDRLFTVGNGTSRVTKSDALVLLKNGNLGLGGTSTPMTKLQISGVLDSSLTTHGLMVLGNITGMNTTFDGNEIIARNNGVAAKLNLNITGGNIVMGNSTSRVGIGRTSPLYPLHMASGAHVTVGGTWVNASSRKLKDNIRRLSADDAQAALLALEPVRYVYKNSRDEEYIGFIAEDVPALVAMNGRDSLASMDIVAVLTKVVKEQQKKIEVLNDKLIALERRQQKEMAILQSKVEMLVRAMSAGNVASIK